jgi:hypothetical protein
MEGDPFASNGLFAAVLLPHLIEKLINRGVLPPSDVSEAADAALLQMEEWQAKFPQHQEAFELARALRNQLVEDYRDGNQQRAPPRLS